MSMDATPIPPHIIHTVFQYILPPSLPLPPHLLSKRLTERHHFLSISPADPTSYLCWPSSDAVKVAEALEHGVSDTLAALEHEVRYTVPDEETVLAHVRPDAHSPLLVVFAWDAETETWRYHDARMLPFPETSLPSLDALPKVELGLECHPIIIDQYGSRSSSPAVDGYWEGYDSSGSSPDTSAFPLTAPTDADDKAEAAYWASYAAVHGSGDSTMPSPRFEKQRLPQDQTYPDDAPDPEATTDSIVAHLRLRLEQHSECLKSSLSSSQSGTHKSGEPPFSEEPKVGTGGLTRDHNYGFPRDDGLDVVTTDAFEQIREKDAKAQATIRSCMEDRDDGVREAIKGIYRLWKSQSGSADAATFINIVKDTLDI